MTETRKDRLSSRYVELHRRLSRALYEQDPWVMGSRVGAPSDEYDHEARELIVRLKGVKDKSEVQGTVRAIFPGASDELVEKIYTAWVSFQEDSKE